MLTDPQEYEEQQQQTPNVSTSPYASPMHNFAGSIILLTNPENELYKLELTLRGLADKDGTLIQSGKALMNDSGIRSVLGLAQSAINRVTVMSNLEDKHIWLVGERLTDALCKDLMLNRIPYEITDATSRSKIVAEVCITSLICMRRAANEGERKFWKGSQQEITTNVGGQKKQGFFSKALGWGK